MELEPKEAHSCFHCSAKLNITTYFSSGLGKQYSDSEATRVCTWDKCKNQNGCCANSSYTLKEWSQDADNEDEKEIQDINDDEDYNYWGFLSIGSVVTVARNRALQDG